MRAEAMLRLLRVRRFRQGNLHIGSCQNEARSDKHMILLVMFEDDITGKRQQIPASVDGRSCNLRSSPRWYLFAHCGNLLPDRRTILRSRSH